MAKIVIVEDDDATRAGYRELLNLAGHEVIATSTYQEGRHAVQVESPDLVIADLRLGGFNGLQLLLLNPRPIPTIIVTGFPDQVLGGGGAASRRRLRGQAYFSGCAGGPRQREAENSSSHDALRLARPRPISVSRQTNLTRPGNAHNLPNRFTQNPVSASEEDAARRGTLLARRRAQRRRDHRSDLFLEVSMLGRRSHARVPLKARKAS